jgi:O-antigen/teichoic acid export membrane protein
LIRGIIGLIAIYILSPWKPGFAFSKRALKELLNFGIPYQFKTFIAVLKDDGVTIVLGRLLGQANLGYIGMARRWSQLPLRFFMDSVTKVTFPAFSRMQEEKDHLAKAVGKSIFFITFLSFPAILGLVAISPVLVRVIPKYNQWIPALVPLGLVSIDSLFASITTQLTNTLDATGRIKTTFKLMLMWTFLTISLVPVLAIKYGVIGAAWGYALTGMTSIVAILIVKKFVNFSFWESFGKTFTCSFVMFLVLILLRGYLSVNVSSLLFLILVGGVVYMSLSIIFMGYSILHDVKKGLFGVFSKN